MPLRVPADLLAAVVAHARAEAPLECCGLLAGTADGGVSLHFPIRNDLASPTDYVTNARDLLAASKAVRAAGAEVLAFYHSHPASRARSRTCGRGKSPRRVSSRRRGRSANRDGLNRCAGGGSRKNPSGGAGVGPIPLA